MVQQQKLGKLEVLDFHQTAIEPTTFFPKKPECGGKLRFADDEAPQ